MAKLNNILACPYCKSELHLLETKILCSRCKERYDYTKSGSMDLKLQKPKSYHYEFTLETPLLPESGFDFEILQKAVVPEVDFSKFDIPKHLTEEILSHFPIAKTDNSRMLDIGCGSMVNKNVCEYAGYEYIGLDYKSDEASILGDAHALPFKDESFDFILSIAVLEPFHENSYYHHTHLGVYNSLHEGGFKIISINPHNKYSVLTAQASMGLFPKMPSFLSKLIIFPLEILHKIWWLIGSLISNKATEVIRIRNTVGAFTFIAKK